MPNFNEARDHAKQRLQRRAVALVAAVAVNAALATGLLAMFDGAASLPWLPATERNLALIANCDPVQGSAPRRACVERVVAAVRASASAVQLASRTPESPPAADKLLLPEQ